MIVTLTTGIYYDDHHSVFVCDNCGKPYNCFRNVAAKHFNEKYCDMCCDDYVMRVTKCPKELVNLKRIILAGKREIKGTRLSQHDKSLLDHIKKFRV